MISDYYVVHYGPDGRPDRLDPVHAEPMVEEGKVVGYLLNCPDHDPNSGPGSDWCPNCRRYAREETSK